MSSDDKQPLALVTGANRGIGKQISMHLAAAGAFVVLSARNVDSLAAVKEHIESSGGQCDCVTVDVTSQEQVAAAVDSIVETHGHIDLLVNNAGIGAGSEPGIYPWKSGGRCMRSTSKGPIFVRKP